MITALRSVGRGRRRVLLQRTSFSLVIEVLSLALAMATFLVLGRSLGPTDYGRYSATISMFAVLGPFAAGGAGHLAVKRVALGMEPNWVWPRLAGIVQLGGILAVAAALGLAMLLLPGVSLWAVAGLALAELVLHRLVPNAVLMTNGLDRPDVGAQLMGLTVFIRLVALGVFFAVGAPGLGTWAVIHLGSGLLTAAMIHLMTARRFGIRHKLVWPTVAEYRQGLPFALTLAPNTVLNDADKTLLTTLGRSTEGGLYAAGYRIAAMSYMPIMAIIRATYSDFFRQGAKGMVHAMRTARRLTVITGGVGLLATGALLAVAPLLPIVLGDDFRDSVLIVQVMAFLPLLKGLEYPAANALTGSNRQYLRVALLTGVAGLNVALNLLLIPSYGWRGAAAATYAAEVVFIAGLWVSMQYLSRAELKASHA